MSELHPTRPVALWGPAAALGHNGASLQPCELGMLLLILGAQGELLEGPKHQPSPAPSHTPPRHSALCSPGPEWWALPRLAR